MLIHYLSALVLVLGLEAWSWWHRVAGFGVDGVPEFVSLKPCARKGQESNPSVEGEYLGTCDET